MKMDLLNEGFTTSRFIKHGNALAFSGCRGSANKSVEDKVVKNVVTDSVLHYDFKPYKYLGHYYANYSRVEMYQSVYSQSMIFYRLIEDRRRKEQLYLTYKLAQYYQKQSECTFKPKISANSVKLAEKDADTKTPLFERLYNEGIIKMKSVDQGDISQSVSYSFQPNLDRRSSGYTHSDLAPIYKRLHEIVSAKREHLKALASYQYQYMKVALVNSKSVYILSRKQDFKKNVLDRLFSHLYTHKSKVQRLVDNKNIQIDRQCPFQPEITSGVEGTMNSGDFLSRQYQLATYSKRWLYYKMKYTYSFQPRINKLSQLLVKAGRYNYTMYYKMDRLNYDHLVYKQNHIYEIEESIYKDCTFHPKINYISRGLYTRPTLHNCRCYHKEEMYDFQPKINAKSKEIVMAGGDKLRMRENKKNVDRVKRELEYREMQECTFKPKTLAKTGRRASDRSLASVAGVETYFRKIQQLQARKAYEESYKQKIFQLEKQYKSRSFTKVAEFKLAQPYPAIKKLKEEAEEEFKKACPFQPTLLHLR